MEKMKNREKTKEQLKEELRKTKEEVAIQKWGLKKTLRGMKVLVKEIIQKKKEVEEAKAKNEALLESIGEGVIAVDARGKILFVNHAFEELLGWKQNEVVGKLMVEVVPREDEAGNPIPFKESILSQVLAGKKVTTTTAILPVFYFVRKNKTRFLVSIVVTPVIIDNNIIGAIEIFRDITKEKEQEKLRTDFLSLASHQLRTPLSGIKWLIETMQKGLTGKIEKKEKEYLDQIYQVNERMIQLVSEMLGVLRLESESGPIKKEKVLISNLYKDISITMTVAAKSRKIILHSALKDHKLAAVETNQEILKNILECFISNAINYSKNGQEVVLDAKEEPDAVVFSVKDSGIGIPKEEQKGIFERFHRGSNAKNLRPGGTGLGLNIARMLAEKIGAAISFESKENKGSTFYLRLPKVNDKIIK